MDAWGNSGDQDVFGNSAGDAWGNTAGTDAWGAAPHDVLGNHVADVASDMANDSVSDVSSGFLDILLDFFF